MRSGFRTFITDCSHTSYNADEWRGQAAVQRRRLWLSVVQRDWQFYGELHWFEYQQLFRRNFGSTLQCGPYKKSPFLSRVSTLTRDINIANLCLSVRYVPVSDENGLTYCHNSFTTRSPNHSNFTSIEHFNKIPTGSPPAGVLHTNGV